MASKNYSAWDIDPALFPKNKAAIDQLRFFVGFAILAPSGHNSQPWEFSVEPERIRIFANRERSLADSDPSGRQLLIAIGCALENLLIAADYCGFSTEVKYLPDGSQKGAIADVFLRKTRDVNSDPKHLIFSIPKRMANRGKYKNTTLPNDFMEKIKAVASQYAEIRAISEQDKKAAIADVVNEAQITVMDSPVFREELSHYVKSSFTKSKVGMPGFTLGIPAPVSLFVSFLIKRINMSRVSKKDDDALLKRFTPSFGIIATADDAQTSWLRAGQAFERIWLLAAQQGVACAPLAAGVQVGDYYKKLQSILKTAWRPQVFFRMGYPQRPARHAPRLTIEDVIRRA